MATCRCITAICGTGIGVVAIERSAGDATRSGVAALNSIASVTVVTRGAGVGMGTSAILALIRRTGILIVTIGVRLTATPTSAANTTVIRTGVGGFVRVTAKIAAGARRTIVGAGGGRFIIVTAKVPTDTGGAIQRTAREALI